MPKHTSSEALENTSHTAGHYGSLEMAALTPVASLLKLWLYSIGTACLSSVPLPGMDQVLLRPDFRTVSLIFLFVVVSASWIIPEASTSQEVSHDFSSCATLQQGLAAGQVQITFR